MSRLRSASPALAAPLLAALLTAPAGADLLVLRDGTRVETKGAWSERGALVVFTDTRGELRSLRASEIDLARSREATAAAATAAAAPSAPASSAGAAEPVLRLTEADLPPVDDPDSMTPAERELRPVVLYSTSWCGWCRKTRALLGSLGVEYVDYDVERDARAALARDRLTGGSRAVPVVDWRGEVVRGFAESRFRDLAARDRRAAARAAAEEAAAAAAREER
jgi:glutaredoxin